jgi:magnesium transporter
VTLPAVLVGGWYGMNFEHMPELKSPHGYLYACLLTLVSTIAMLVYLKRKKWF